MEAIPKIIHYCWFGKGKKSELINDCIKSWKLLLPDYEIRYWDETNISVDIPFVLQAYKLKKWAFVSDYIRLKVLHDYGGIYLDTDMIVTKNFDKLLINSCFFGIGGEKYIYTGIIGAIKGHSFINFCLEYYKSNKDLDLNNIKQYTSPKIITKCFKDYYNFNKDFKNQLNLKEITIFPEEYFYPMPETERHNKLYEKYILKNTYTIHLWEASWVEFSAFKLIREKQYFKGVKKMFEEILTDKKYSLLYFRKIASSFKQSFKNKKS